MLLDLIQTSEEGDNCFLVRFLRGGEPGLIDAVVDVIVCPFVRGFDLGLQSGWEEGDVLVFWGEEVVELFLHAGGLVLVLVLVPTS